MQSRPPRYFLAVHDAGNLPVAAEKVNIIQPALSKATQTSEIGMVSSCSTVTPMGWCRCATATRALADIERFRWNKRADDGLALAGAFGNVARTEFLHVGGNIMETPMHAPPWPPRPTPSLEKIAKVLAPSGARDQDMAGEMLSPSQFSGPPFAASLRSMSALSAKALEVSVIPLETAGGSAAWTGPAVTDNAHAAHIAFNVGFIFCPPVHSHFRRRSCREGGGNLKVA